MRKSVRYTALLLAVALAGLYPAHRVMATPGNSGFKGTTLIKATFDEFSVFNSLVIPASDTDGKASVWLSSQKTKGRSDVYIQTNTWDPGGSTGWHTHPGHSLIIITQGTITEYDGDDPTCSPHTYTGTLANPATLVDPGGDHVHLIRNEGDVQVKGYAIQIVPANAQRRIDAEQPAACAGLL